MKFDVIYADPPWQHNDRKKIRKDGKKPRFGVGANNHYATLSLEELCALDMASISNTPSVLLLWALYPMLPEALQVMQAWGFKYSTIAFTWVKLNKGLAREHPSKLANLLELGLYTFLEKMRFFGIGYWTKSNGEFCLLGVRGSPVLQPVVNNVSSIVFAPVGKHSEKPCTVAHRIEKLWGPERSYLELFAREGANGSALPGWTATGLEFDGVDVRVAIRALQHMDTPHTYSAVAEDILSLGVIE